MTFQQANGTDQNGDEKETQKLKVLEVGPSLDQRNAVEGVITGKGPGPYHQ